MDCRRLVWLSGCLLAALAPFSHTPSAAAQAVMGTCASCGGGATDPNCGACIASGSECFNALMPADCQLGVFMTSDGHDARSLTFGKLVRGAQESATDINRAVSSTYNSSNIWLYYGAGTPPPPDGYCAPAGGPPPAFSDPGDYVFGWDHRYEDTMNGLDCYNGEVDRFYLGASGHADGSRVCDGEQGFFDPSNGAIFISAARETGSWFSPSPTTRRSPVSRGSTRCGSRTTRWRPRSPRPDIPTARSGIRRC